MSKPTIFISYSHKDERLKDRLVSHLGVLQQEGLLEVWEDRRIGAGKDWEQEIEAALNKARVAILLISDHFLNSKFILTKEVPVLMQRRISDGLRVIPVILSDCPWRKVSWLSPIQSRPRDGRALTSFTGNKRNQELSKIATEVSELMDDKASSSHLSLPIASVVPLAPDKISIARLPQLLTRDLFGRERELQLLDEAWANPATNVVTFVAWGGVGKSALTSHWLMRLEQENYRGAERVYSWSFYSQGTSDHAATAEYFINDALRWFGGDELADKLATALPWEKGERLARLVRQTRTLLILDGLEPVQYPPGPLEGRLKEQSLQALLRELAAQQPGLCVISTREAIGDLAQYEGRTLVRHDLTNLSPQAGAQLLRELKVKGDDTELEAAAREYDGHSLALTLLGSYLGDVYAGDVRRRHEIESLEGDFRHGWQVTKMMRAYEKWLGERQELAMLDVLRLLGLFDYPADAASIAALRDAPAIPGLTDALTGLDERRWRQTMQALRRIRLLAEVAVTSPDTLDAHPLVREYFRARIKQYHHDAWREAHRRLYEHLTSKTEKIPDTIEEMLPLYRAVAHGCEAGKYEEALNVYWEKIQRKNQGYASKKLAGEAHQLDLSIMANFFAYPWSQLVDGLNAGDQAYVFSKAGAGFYLLGLPRQAVPLFEKGLSAYLSASDYIWASSVARSLSACHSVLGELETSLKFAERGDDLAQEGVRRAIRHFKGKTVILRENEIYFARVCSLVEIATVLHQMGRIKDSLARFKEAEDYQKQNELWPLLYSTNGYCYNDLLLDQGYFSKVLDRTKKTKAWSQERKAGLFSRGWENISIGRALLLRDLKRKQKISNKTKEYIEDGLDLLRRSGAQDFLISGLLVRNALYRVLCNYQLAQSDLDEARRIAERGEMRRRLCDCHLESARLSLATGDRASARKAWETAKAMIEQMGYHRWDGEVTEIEAQLNAAGE